MSSFAQAVLFPAASFADCPDGQDVFLSCTTHGGQKVLSTCYDATTANYSFGPPGRPELSLQVLLTETELAPWPGIGSSMWSELTFWSGGFAYTVHGTVERDLRSGSEDGLDETISGGVLVTRDGDEIARIACDPGSIVYLSEFGMMDALRRLGRCFDDNERSWGACAPED